MPTSEAKKLAQEFLRDQAAIIKKYGHKPQMSGKKFKRVLNETKRTFEALKAVSAKGARGTTSSVSTICPNCHQETPIGTTDSCDHILMSRKQCEICRRNFLIVNGVPMTDEDYAKS